MENKYMCMKCKCAGAKSLVPFKIIEDRDGMSVKFMGQLCERCFNELFKTEENSKKNQEEKNNAENQRRLFLALFF